MESYDKLPAFSSFLPGLAGVRGIPLWVFYTNRGQGINSFGIHHKGNAIMEFNPANTAYENTPVKGFRTFLRKDGNFFEPFCSYSSDSDRNMAVEQNRLAISDVTNGISTNVSYFVLPNESIGALVRHVEIKNVSDKECQLEGIDGIPKIIPFGIQNGQFKEMSNLFKSWTDVRNIENKAPQYMMRASSDDSAEVKEITGGYFYCTERNGALTDVIYDAEVVFGYDNSLVTPVVFKEGGITDVKKLNQCFANKVPCGFTYFDEKLKPGDSIIFTTYIGYAGSCEQLNEHTAKFCEAGFAANKEKEATKISKELTGDIKTHTGNPVFDSYMEQCYLDNFLRGGYPYVFGSEKNRNVVHLFSRKHGDPERDYNFFSTAGEYYSQGNGNFRDVCQNRRSDVFFHPEIGDFNVWSFWNYVQMDGYNPLEIRPCTFSVKEEDKEAAKQMIKEHVAGDATVLVKLLEDRFTPGRISTVIAENQIAVKDEEKLIEKLLEISTEELEAGFLEGYWSDHWDYLMDLIENYLLIFPDKREELLNGRNDYRFYDSEGIVRPRKETYVNNKGKIRQYGNMEHSKEKASRQGFVAGGTNWVKNPDGTFVTTTLLGKMLTLALNKFLLLDQNGMGIEMEGGKPGWNDAMNGLPGLFGSSMPETLELERVLSFIDESLEKTFLSMVKLPDELIKLANRIGDAIDKKNELSDFEYWNLTANLREEFRAEINMSVSGKSSEIEVSKLSSIIKKALVIVESGIDKALKYGNGILPTYFTHEAVKYTARLNEDGSEYITPYGLPGVEVSEFKCNMVVPFLEGPARLLSCRNGHTEEKLEMHRHIRNTDMYDNKLKMYKTSGSLEELSMEHGRVRAFTPGWLERESVFLHMEYKYILGLLKSGLYEEYYESMKDALIPFLSPDVYGRSTLENSSFLASSVNPDEKTHGRGFVARLSGSTTEAISMWISMFVGDGGFDMNGGELTFSLKPRLADWMFDEEGKAGFTLLSKTEVVYVNSTHKSTYKETSPVTKLEILYADGIKKSVCGDTLAAEDALLLRNGEVREIRAYI